MVLDFEEAFFQVPLSVAERPWFTCRIGDEWFCFLRTAQASRGAPTVWGRGMSFFGRAAQALDTRRALRTNIYVDDPLLLAAGTPQLRLLSLSLSHVLSFFGSPSGSV